MRKTKKVKVTKEEVQVTDIVCNMCAQSCCNQKRKEKPDANFMNEYSGLIEAVVSGGYDSEVVGDGVAWRFSLCEGCLNQVVSKFKIPHEVKDSSLSSEFESAEKLEKRRAKLTNSYRKECIDILAKNTDLTKKELIKKTTEELFKLYQDYSSWDEVMPKAIRAKS